MFFIYDFSIHFKIIKKHPPPAGWQAVGVLPIFRAVVVEPRGIEPLSENPSSRLSPGAECLLDLPRLSAGKQALRFGSL